MKLKLNELNCPATVYMSTVKDVYKINTEELDNLYTLQLMSSYIYCCIYSYPPFSFIYYLSFYSFFLRHALSCFFLFSFPYLESYNYYGLSARCSSFWCAL